MALRPRGDGNIPRRQNAVKTLVLKRQPQIKKRVQATQNMGKYNCNIFVILSAKEKPAVFLAGVVGVVVVVLLFAFGRFCIGKFIT